MGGAKSRPALVGRDSYPPRLGVVIVLCGNSKVVITAKQTRTLFRNHRNAAHGISAPAIGITVWSDNDLPVTNQERAVYHHDSL